MGWTYPGWQRQIAILEPSVYDQNAESNTLKGLKNAIKLQPALVVALRKDP